MSKKGDVRLVKSKFLICVKGDWWEAEGFRPGRGGHTAGRVCKVNGKEVRCGHRHETQAGANKCAARMRASPQRVAPCHRVVKMSEWKPLSKEGLEKIREKNARRISALVRTVSSQGGVRLEKLERDRSAAESLGVTWSMVLDSAFELRIQKMRATRRKAA